MMFTAVSIASLAFNIILLALLIWLFSIVFRQNKQIKKLVDEMSNESLEHYLEEIKKRGYDFTLKPKKKKQHS